TPHPFSPASTCLSTARTSRAAFPTELHLGIPPCVRARAIYRLNRPAPHHSWIRRSLSHPEARTPFSQWLRGQRFTLTTTALRLRVTQRFGESMRPRIWGQRMFTLRPRELVSAQAQPLPAWQFLRQAPTMRLPQAPIRST